MCLEADVGALRAFVRLRGDEAPALEDPPGRRDRRGRRSAQSEVVEDRLRARIEPLLDELLTEPHDTLRELVRAPVSDPTSGLRTRRDRLVAAALEARHERRHPALRETV